MSLLLLFSALPLIEIMEKLSSLGEQSTTQGFLPVGLGTTEIQSVLYAYGTWAQGIQAYLTELSVGDSFMGIQGVLNRLPEDIQNFQAIRNLLSSYIYESQAIRNIITEDAINRIHAVLLKIAEIDPAQDYQVISQYIGGISATRKSVSYAIYLDGKNITRRASSAAIDYSEMNIHNSISLNSNDLNLFNWSNPFDRPGTERIEVHVGSRVLKFLLEKRSGSETKFSLWGRSISATEDSPYADEITYTLSTPKLAEDVAEEILTLPLTWDCDNWILPESFEFRGTPIQGIMKIAQVIGAKVRSDDDGSIIVRNAFPVRPVDLNSAPSALSYDRDTILEGMSYSEVPGERYNEIEVLGSSIDENIPSLELEESGPYQGTTVHVRAYWQKIYPPGLTSTAMTALVTSGIVFKGVDTREVIEKVYFKSGVANASYPISSLKHERWIGADLGTITSSIYEKELTASSGVDNPTKGFGIAEITYDTVFGYYELSNHDIEELMFILSHQLGYNVDVLIKSVGENDITSYVAPAISDPLITESSIAVLRGKNWLDSHKYDKKIFQIRAPYDDAAKDGIIIFLNDGEIGCSGNFYMKSSSIVFKGPKVTNEMEAVQWQV